MIDRGRNEHRTAAAAAALRLFVGLLGPPLVWLTSLQLLYGIAAFACEVGVSRLPMHATTAVTLAVIAATVLGSWRDLRASETVAPAGAGGHLSSFLASGGLVLAAQFLLVIVAQELAIVFFGPCH